MLDNDKMQMEMWPFPTDRLMEMWLFQQADSNITDLWGHIFFECLNIMTHNVELSQVEYCEEYVLDVIPKLIFHM